MLKTDQGGVSVSAGNIKDTFEYHEYPKHLMDTDVRRVLTRLYESFYAAWAKVRRAEPVPPVVMDATWRRLSSLYDRVNAVVRDHAGDDAHVVAQLLEIEASLQEELTQVRATV